MGLKGTGQPEPGWFRLQTVSRHDMGPVAAAVENSEKRGGMHSGTGRWEDLGVL